MAGLRFGNRRRETRRAAIEITLWNEAQEITRGFNLKVELKLKAQALKSLFADMILTA